MDYNHILKNTKFSSEKRIQAVFKLMAENSEESIQCLIKAFEEDPSPIVRHECAFCLGEVDSNLGEVALIKAIQTDAHHFVVHEAALALANLGSSKGKDIINPLLKNKDHNIVLTAKICLQRLNNKRLKRNQIQNLEDAEKIILLKEAEPESRIQAAFKLMEKGSETSVSILINALHLEIDPIVKHEIIFSIGETASIRCAPFLIKEIEKDSNVYVRHKAALALGDVIAKPFLEKLLSDHHPDIVESSEIALERLGPL